MNHYEISQDPIWHKWLDAVVILVIGISLGMVMSQAIQPQEVTTVTTTEIVKRSESTPVLEADGVVDIPAGTVLEEN